MSLFERSDVVAGPVLDIRDIMNDPHYRARENIVAVPDPETQDRPTTAGRAGASEAGEGVDAVEDAEGTGPAPDPHPDGG